MRPVLLGHRGASALEPENTMRAFARAVADGADGVELDVRLCATGEVVVVHDPDLRRRAGDPRCVGDLDLARLRRVDVGGGERVPLLHEVLDLASSSRFLLNVEVKTNGPRGSEVAAALCRSLARRGLGRLDHVSVSSFDPRALAVVRLRARAIRTGLLYGRTQGWLLRSGLSALVVGATAVHPQSWLVDAGTVRAWQRRGRAVNVWTVDDPSELRRLQAIGVDGIICNDPGAARRSLGP